MLLTGQRLHEEGKIPNSSELNNRRRRSARSAGIIAAGLVSDTP